MAEPTLQTIADALGISKMTVSRALRHFPSVPVETVARVEAEARRQGYRPDPLVTALMRRMRTSRLQKQTPLVAYVDSVLLAKQRLEFNYLRKVAAGARARGEQLGYRLEYFNLAELKMSPARLGKVLYSRGIRGVLIAPTLETGPFKMDFSHFASATVGPSVTEPDICRAQSSHVRNIERVIREVRALGCHRIGMVLEENQDGRTEKTLGAMLLRHQMEIPENHRVPLLLVPKLDYRTYFTWLDEHRPDVVIGFRHGLADWLKKRSGGKPLIVNLNWQGETQSDYGIDQQMDQIGAAALDLVVEQLQTNQYGIPRNPKRVHLPGRWVRIRHGQTQPRT